MAQQQVKTYSTMKVEIVSKKLVKPSDSAPDRLERLKISCIDQLQYPGYVPLLLFYKGTGCGQQAALSEGVRDLEESLSEALTHFYPLAGRYVDDDLSIRCTDEGVEFTVAMVDDPIDQILRTRPCPEEKLRDLVISRHNLAENASLIAIQVNVFQCGGLAICVSFSHMVADIGSMSMFVKSWASSSSRMESCDASITIRPDFTSPARFPAIKLSEVNRPHVKIEAKMVRDRFTFPAERWRKELGMSRVVMVTAIICKALLNSVDQGRRYGTIFHSYNLRGRFNPPVAGDYFGNMYSQAPIKLMLEDGKDAELDGVAKLIVDGLKSVREMYSAAASDAELCSMIGDSMRQFKESLLDNKKCLMRFGSWCGFGLHKNDFGCGPPELIWDPGFGVRLTQLVDRPDGGMDALVTLSEDDMVLFKQDPDITRLFIF